MNCDVKVRLLTDTAKMPTRGSEHAAAWDLYADKNTLIPAGKRAMVSTGLSMAFSSGFVALIKDRSGLAAKHGLTHQGGVIDADYRGEWMVILHNTADSDYSIKAGERIAQVVFAPIPHVTLEEVDLLEDTDRGVGAFGSTGY